MFIGWYDNAEFNGEAVTEVATGSKGNKTFYAKWEILRFEVRFLDYDGREIGVESQEVEYGSLVVVPNDPIKGNCTFEGWYRDAGFESEYNFGSAVTGELVIYAKFLVEVILNVDNFTQSRTFTLKNLLNNLTSVESTKPGYSIGGWTYEDEILSEEIELNFDEAIVFEAILVPNVYTIYFDLNYEDNKEEIDPIGVVYGDEIGVLPEPTRRGSIFLGWYYGEELIESTDIYQIVGDVTLLAGWEIISLDFTLIYIASGVAVFLITMFIILIFKKIAKMRRYERTSKLNMLKRKVK